MSSGSGSGSGNDGGNDGRLEVFFERLWKNYAEKTPQADKIKNHFLLSKGENVVNDHVAFRTFEGDKIGLMVLEPLILKEGYQVSGDYEFPAKKLAARSYQHETNPTIPKIFLSELRTSQFSPEFSKVVQELCDQIDPSSSLDSIDVFLEGRLWDMPRLEQYHLLRNESEYASWLAVNGFCANHFTLSVNHLQNFDLRSVNEEVKRLGFPLNAANGEINGSKDILLEQSSTIAHKQKFVFSKGTVDSEEDVEVEVPTCFYEFIQRYPDQDGQLYQGFRTSNADKIFESTNTS